MRPLRLAAALAATLATSPALAAEQTRFEPVALQILEDGGVASAAGILAIPDGWRAGDAAVLLLRDRRETTAPGLIPALLDGGHAVLEVPADAAGASADIAWLGAGLSLLRGSAEAGLVIAAGAGEAGRAVLLAAEVEAGGTLGAGRLRFAGHVRLGPGAPAFAPGFGWSDDAAWPLHVRAFCDSLLWSLASQVTPVTRAPGAPQGPDAIRRACIGGLDPVTP
jgi:hypothetical protein